ncbi:MAG: ABC transporter ATP-binding protein [Clostridiales bacterium]|nr:ABC transporter ATP-binding protein [Clostridiales bacterium]MDD7688075.1 ABC transporter ATP-binding protein [Clostridiales bacterium]
MKTLAVYLKNYIKECILAPLFKQFEAILELIVPLVMAAIIDRGIGMGDKPYILKMGLLLAAIAVAGFIAASIAQYFAAKAAIGFSTELRSAVLRKIHSLSFSDFDAAGTSTLMTRMTSDINQAELGVNKILRLLLRSPFVVFGAMVVAFTIDTECALIFLGVIALLCIIVLGIMVSTIPMHTKVRQGLDKVTEKTRENLAGVRVLRAFTAEDEEEAEFERRNKKLTALELKVGRVSELLNPLTLIAVNAAIMILIWTGAIKVNIGSLTQGQVVALYNLMSQILVELVKMARLIIIVAKAAASGKRVAKLLNTESTKLSGTALPKANAPKGSVEFSNVTFTYKLGGAPAVENISFTAAPGETIGIIGGTGSGKSSIVNLIPGFYTADSGSIKVDDVEVNSFEPHALMKRIGIVPQKAELFKGSIRSNLLMGNPDADESMMREALKKAQALDIVDSRPEGLDAEVEQGGRNLSGGQKQRLTIARALLKNPEILILDDSASALDYATDAKLRMAIMNTENPPTTFIVSQRAASMLYADKILVMNDGHLIATGRHEELLNSCSVYREIFDSQFSSEGGAA